MSSHFGISQIRSFINKERVYMLMLACILLINSWLILAVRIPTLKENYLAKKVWQFRQTQKIEDEDKLYSLTEIDISLSEVLKEKREKSNIHLFMVLSFSTLFILALGLFLDMRLVMAKIKKREILQATGTHLKINWGIRDIFKLVIIFVFLGYVLLFLEAHFFSSENILRFVHLLNTGIMDLVLLGFIIYFVKVKYQQSLAAIGLRIKGIMRNIVLAILGYIAFLPLLILLLVLLIIVATLLKYQPPQQSLFKLFLQEKRIWLVVYSTIVVVVLGPIVEEIFFRGFTYNAIKRKWGTIKAIVLSAFVFAALHGTLFGFLPILALGILLAYMYEKTSSLIPAITIHILHNAIMVTLLFLARYLIHFAQ